MKALQWRHEEMEKEAIDEQAIRWVLLSVVYRNLDDLEKAKEYIQKTLTVDRYAFKGNFVDNWMCTSHPPSLCSFHIDVLRVVNIDNQ